MKKCAIFFVFAMLSFSLSAYAENRDQYLSGYATAMLQQRFALDINVFVRNNELFLPQAIKDNVEYDAIVAELSQIEGINKIKIVSEIEMLRMSNTWEKPRSTLFKPLLADPKWPKFHVSFHRYNQDEYEIFNKSIDAAMGDTFSLVRTGRGDSAFYSEVALQAGAFTIFDSTTDSFDMINVDYIVGFPITFSWPGFTLMTRIYHESSHLGDEYILNNEDMRERENFSYEMVEILGSLEPTDWFRLYLGGGFIPDPSPVEYGYWTYHGGMELYVSSLYTNIPNIVFAVDIKGFKPTSYSPTYSAMLGFELFEDTYFAFEASRGYSQNGQFYENDISYFGIGFHLY